MTKVKIEPGVCGFTAIVTAEKNEYEEITVSVASGCKAVQGMMEAVGDTFNPYEVCLVKPGCGPFYAYASENFPVHAACPVIAGIGKCIEAEAGLALKKDASIHFMEE